MLNKKKNIPTMEAYSVRMENITDVTPYYIPGTLICFDK